MVMKGSSFFWGRKHGRVDIGRQWNGELHDHDLRHLNVTCLCTPAGRSMSEAVGSTRGRETATRQTLAAASLWHNHEQQFDLRERHARTKRMTARYTGVRVAVAKPA